MDSLNDLSKKIYKANKKKGFHEGEKNIGEMLCLIHSEVSEALEADRKEKHQFASIKGVIGWKSSVDFKHYFEEHTKDTFEDELADTIIRILDLCGMKKIDIESHIEAKMRYNEMREHKHGKKY